jgi:hypothetical protein
MKTVITMGAAFLLLCCQPLQAQSINSPKLYGGISSGVDNPYGAIGGNLELALLHKFSVSAGAGLSIWGLKYVGEMKYYFKNITQSWAISGGMSHSNGMKVYDVDVEDASGKRKVDIMLKPMNNVFGSVYHFWKLGKRNNRFHLQAGYSARLTDNYYSFNQMYTPTGKEQRLMKSLSPGGLILGVGFSFALSK